MLWLDFISVAISQQRSKMSPPSLLRYSLCVHLTRLTIFCLQKHFVGFCLNFPPELRRFCFRLLRVRLRPHFRRLQGLFGSADVFRPARADLCNGGEERRCRLPHRSLGSGVLQPADAAGTLRSERLLSVGRTDLETFNCR